MSLQDVVRWFFPKDDRFYEYLEQQAKVAHEGAKALAEFSSDGSSAEAARDTVQAFEHEGDRIVHELEEALAKTFVTPIDREDLHKLSAELDGVLDLTNGAIRACVLLGVTRPTEAMKKLIAIIVQCTDKIAQAVPNLRKHHYAEIVVAAREVRAIEKEADTVYREALSELFRIDPGTSANDARVLIREKTVLDDLENAIDQCDAIADTLTNLAVKHG